MKASQPDLALAAVLDGANTAGDIAIELGVSRRHASMVVHRLLREGALRWTGKRLPRDPEVLGSRGQRVLEIARP